MESLEMRVADLERSAQNYANNIYALELSCSSLAAQMNGVKTCLARLSTPCTPIEQVRQDAQAEPLDMSAVTELTAKQMNMDLTLESLSNFIEQSLLESPASVIGMNQRQATHSQWQQAKEQIAKRQDSHVELDEAYRAARKEAPTLIGNQHLQGTVFENIQPASITELRVRARKEKHEEDSALVSDNVPQADNFVAMEMERGHEDHDTQRQDGTFHRDAASIRRSDSLFSQHRIDYYAFGESLWNLSLLLGVRQMGVGVSVFVMFLMCAQISVQLTLICIINEAFTEASIDGQTAQDMHNWRVYSGHAYSLVDSVTFEPLAKRICSYDESIPYSEGVRDIFERISAYMPLKSDYDRGSPMFGHLLPGVGSIGITLCLLCIAIWLMNIISSLSKNWELIHALKHLQHAKGACITQDSDGTLTLQTLPAPRKIWCGVLITMQIMVEIFLGVMGVMYMIFTISLRDLLLNCSALMVVLELDFVFYAALAPREAKILMRALNPLVRPHPTTINGLNWEVAFFVACLITTCGCSYAALRNQADTLEATRENICGGNQDFVYLANKVGMVFAGEPQQTVAQDSYRYKAVEQLIGNKAVARLFFAQNGSLSGTAGHGMVGSKWSLGYLARIDASESVAFYNPRCADMLPASVHKSTPYFLEIVQDVAHNHSIHDCNDLRSFCSADTVLGTRSRQFCPTTCGCDDVGVAPVLSGVIGCPLSCSQSSRYLASIAAKGCVDESKGSDYFRHFVDGLTNMQRSYPPAWVSDFPKSISLIQQYGCELIQKNVALSFLGAVWTDLCRDSAAYIIPLTFACPVLCECGRQYRAGCPVACLGKPQGEQR